MLKPSLVSCTLLVAAIGLGSIAGCENLHGHPRDTPTTGAATPAGGQITDNQHPISRVIAGGLGAGGGFLIGASRDKLEQDKTQARDDAIKASQRAEKNPAKPEDVDKANSADLNNDGFVTLDEVVAMRQANLNDPQMLDRLQRTGQLFELTEYQQDYLRTRGVSDNVIHQIPTLTHDTARTASDQTGTTAVNRDRAL